MPSAADLAERVREGDLRLYELEDHADADTAAAARRQLLAEEVGADLETVGDYSFPGERAEPNIENMIGAAQIPMGVAGPLPIDGSAAADDFYVPLATTEGALVASVNRGMGAIRNAGGANAEVLKYGITRAPVFSVADVTEAAEVVEWVEDNEDLIEEVAEETDPHIEYQDVTPYVVGDNVFLRFDFDTGDAMGMNMVTIASRSVAETIEAETPASLVAVSGNLCTDKKPAAINAVEGRGYTVAADVVIPRAVVEDRFGTTPEAIAEVNTRKNLVGSAKAASLGFNAHVANVVGAAFLALGQDEAHVVDGSNAITSVEAREDGLYASVTFSSLPVGTVGGGTGLPTQSEALEVLGLAGGGDPVGTNGDALAEVIAAAGLAGELSLLGALAGRHLASAHEEHGR
ncbi:hydroxymethylglutaryl-CoA reductase (NADPH) [Halapricum desulfuricans]|uniref:3-hydroxy-3-methylglutaryl coenzyme A reductase n=1 Tax=Halapricum desulfuricans TaxID=2841257 RepID=A0A897NSA6_9EURY|nr:hydroxymethylglutaryl-CoA reductase (NADPH) [Halapricum desulfuricans]QSG13679.1 Hydroxymethylglutaryl-CoA reductase [Halapricum desulfuricans]